MKDTDITSDLFLDLLNHTTAMKNYSHCNPTSNMPMGIELGILHTKLDNLANELDKKERINKCSFGKFEEDEQIEYEEDEFEPDDELSCFKKLVIEKEKNLTLTEECTELESQLDDWRDDQITMKNRIQMLELTFENLIRKDHIFSDSLQEVIRKLITEDKSEEYFYALLGKSK